MNKIYAIIGPHAAGKTTIIAKLKIQGIPSIVSHTTRKPRSNEKNGREYYFVNKEEFLKLDLVEKVTYQGDYYGITKSELLTKMQASKINTVMVEQNGYKQLKKLLGDRLESIYIMVDYVTMVERMLNQNEDNDQIKKQLEYTETNGELETWKITNHVVKNTGNITITINQILALMGLLARR
ncbi:guanylate kinase [Anaerosinus massiliensis]|uniref:guanylate kinase n=1 Tax=Massilibacillus massiliensis TaxID=1806837 RepID=UPI000DA630C1|nr:guanylate kinase [Massilibacillus massiliensis]